MLSGGLLNKKIVGIPQGQITLLTVNNVI
jgi:hypothetical protein